jgi:hypothetical protein
LEDGRKMGKQHYRERVLKGRRSNEKKVDLLHAVPLVSAKKSLNGKEG